MRLLKMILLLILFVALLSACSKEEKQVVVYTSVDQVYSKVIFEKFENETGIEVLPVYDIEANKTTGLVNRLIEEKDNPVANVFWNGEISQTILLKNQGILDKYEPKNAKGLPQNFIDRDGYYTAFGGRARIILVNTKLLDEKDYPSSIFDILDEKYDQSKIAVAYPMFGTSLTHAAALTAKLGIKECTSFYTDINSSDIQVVDGNSVVRDKVVSKEAYIGITDTDDALSSVKKGKSVKIIIPDQSEDDYGTLVIPNTVAMISNDKNKEETKIFIEFLLSEETEQELLDIGWFQMATRASSNEEIDNAIEDLSPKVIDVTFDEIDQNMKATKEMLQKIFIN